MSGLKPGHSNTRVSSFEGATGTTTLAGIVRVLLRSNGTPLIRG